MDMSTSLRVKMAEKRATAAQVADLVGRTRVTVSRWRAGEPIPLAMARILVAEDFLHPESLLEQDAAA